MRLKEDSRSAIITSLTAVCGRRLVTAPQTCELSNKELGTKLLHIIHMGSAKLFAQLFNHFFSLTEF